MLNFNELTEEQKVQLKQKILVDREPSVSWWELFMADNIVSDKELEDMYGDTVFSKDDFWG
jgi:hypothetical protein